MTRRTCLSLASAAFAYHRAGATEDISDLYRRSIVVDGLANAGTFNIMWPPIGPLSSKRLASIAASGITAVNHTVTVGAANFESVVAGLAFWEQAGGTACGTTVCNPKMR